MVRQTAPIILGSPFVEALINRITTFLKSLHGAEGQYQFLRYDGDGHWKTLKGGPTSLLLSGIGKSNTITIVAIGHTFSFLINGKPVRHSVTDSSSAALTAGEVGFSVEEEGTEIVFSHLYIDDSIK